MEQSKHVHRTGTISERLRALAAFSEPDAAETLERGANLIEYQARSHAALVEALRECADVILTLGDDARLDLGRARQATQILAYDRARAALKLAGEE